MSGPLFGTSGTLLTGTAGTASFVVPASVASGDFIVVVFFLDGTNTVTAYPSGFAEAENSPVTLPAGGGTHSLHVVWKRATGADTGTYDFTFAASSYREGAAHRYTGVVASGTPFDSPTGSASDTANGTTTPPVNTTTLGADRLLLFAGTDWSGGSWTPPTSYAERMDGGVGLVTLDDLAQAVAGGSGSISATSTGSNKRTAWIGGLIPVAAAAASATPQPLVVTSPTTPQPASVLLLRAPLPPATPIQPLVVTPRQVPAPATAITSRGSLADAPVLTTARPIVVTAAVVAAAASSLLLRAPTPVVAPVSPQPLVVNASVAVPPAQQLVLRSTLADPPVLTTVSPSVITRPAAPSPGAALLLRGSLIDVAPVITATPAPIVITAPQAASPAAAVLLRGALSDAPVLTTAAPLVITAATPPPLATTIQARNQQAAAVVSGPTTAPYVVTQSGQLPAAAAILVRSSLLDASVAVPGPLVVSSPAPIRAPLAIVTRGSLADAPVLTTVGPLVITAAPGVPPATAQLRRNPQQFIAPASGPSTVPIVVTAAAPAASGQAVLIRAVPTADTAPRTPTVTVDLARAAVTADLSRTTAIADLTRPSVTVAL